MAATKIAWTEATWNPTVGCTWAGPECDHCYAVTMTCRLEAMGKSDYKGLTTGKHFNGVVRTLGHKLDAPLGWKKPRMIFVNSMSDLFHGDVPFEFIDKVFAVMALCPQHVFQVLTKRPEGMANYLLQNGGQDKRYALLDAARTLGYSLEFAGMRIYDWPLPNVWLGTSIGTRAKLEKCDPLCRTPAAVRFLSLEPLLEDLGDIRGWLKLGIDQVIVGCESRGPYVGRLPGGTEAGYWEAAESLREQCEDAGVAFFHKQGPVNGRVGHEMEAWPESLRVRQFPHLEPDP